MTVKSSSTLYVVLVGLGPIENRPSINKDHWFDKEKISCMTSDMWQITHNMWHVTYRGWWTLSRSLRSLASSSNSLGVMMSCDTWHVTCYIWHVTCDMWQVTCDTWHVRCDTWHITHEIWHTRVVNIVSKFQVPSSNCFPEMIFINSAPLGQVGQ